GDALTSGPLAPHGLRAPRPPPLRDAARGGAGAGPARLAVRAARRRGAVVASRPRGVARVRALARVGRGPRGRRRDRAPRPGERQGARTRSARPRRLRGGRARGGAGRGWDRGAPGRADGAEARLRAGAGRESRGRLKTPGWRLAVFRGV